MASGPTSSSASLDAIALTLAVRLVGLARARGRTVPCHLLVAGVLLLAAADVARLGPAVAGGAGGGRVADGAVVLAVACWVAACLHPMTRTSVDAQSPNVIGRASLYGAFPRLEADDTIRHDATCCDGAEFEHGTWQVVGGSRGWGPGMVVVPIDKAA